MNNSVELESSPEEAIDFILVKGMIRAASREGLLAEVVLFFGRNMQAGESVDSAARHALHEWDII